MGEDLRLLFLPERDVVTFAFLGAYVFAVNTLFRRYTRSDLGPKAYTHIIVRTIVAVATTWVVSFAPFAGGADGDPQSLLLLLAFLIGIVPETGIAVIQDVLQKRLGDRAIPSLAEKHSLSQLNGISLYDRTHLLEVGIENVESLAHHHLVDLMLWTRIPTPRLVDFVDQAILYLHVQGPGDPSSADGDDAARTRLCHYGIRTASDLERAYERASGRSAEEGDRLLALLDPPDAPVSRLRVALDAMQDDEWMVYVRNWREQSSAAEPVRSVEEFVDLSSRPVPAPPVLAPLAEPPAPANGAAGTGSAEVRRRADLLHR